MIPPKLPSSFRPQAQRRDHAFSLVEVVLAVGVVAFAFVAILGLIPAGLTQFRQAVDTSVGAQIAQRVIMDAQQSDFEVLTDWENLPKTGTGIDARPNQNLSFRAPKFIDPQLRYFDEQGSEVVPVNPKSLSLKEQGKVIYHVNTRITPRTAFPRVNATGETDSQAQATVTVEVAFNPGNKKLEYYSGSSKRTTPNWNLIDVSKSPGVTVKTYSAQVGRN